MVKSAAVVQCKTSGNLAAFISQGDCYSSLVDCNVTIKQSICLLHTLSVLYCFLLGKLYSCLLVDIAAKKSAKSMMDMLFTVKYI